MLSVLLKPIILTSLVFQVSLRVITYRRNIVLKQMTVLQPVSQNINTKLLVSKSF